MDGKKDRVPLAMVLDGMTGAIKEADQSAAVVVRAQVKRLTNPSKKLKRMVPIWMLPKLSKKL
jgi:hypothetical protein